MLLASDDMGVSRLLLTHACKTALGVLDLMLHSEKGPNLMDKATQKGLGKSQEFTGGGEAGWMG